MVLYRACWHIVVANSEALRRAGIPVEVRRTSCHPA
jgi:predicted amidohydrolase YtcJ